MSVQTTVRQTFTVANKAAQQGIGAAGSVFDVAATSVGMLDAFVAKEALLQKRGYAAEISIRTQELSMQLTERTVAINKAVEAMDTEAKSIYDNLLKQMEEIN